MALLTYQWQPPSFDSLIANALHGQQQQRLLAIQELEQERLARQKATDLAMQLRQEQRIADSEHFKQQLEGAQEVRRAAESAAKLHKTPPPLLPEGDSPALPTDSAPTPAGPTPTQSMNMADTPTPAVPVAPYNSLLSSPSTPTDASQLSLDNPAQEVNLGIQQDNPLPQASALPAVDFAETMRGSTGPSVPVQPPGDPGALPDYASMLRDQGGIPAASGGGASGGDAMPEANAGGSMDMVDAIRRGEGLPTGPTPAAATPAGDGGLSSLSAADRKMLNDVARLERAGQLPEGEWKRQFEGVMQERRILQRKTTSATAPGARMKYSYQDEDGNLYAQMDDGTWKDGKAPPPGAKKVGTASAASGPRVKDTFEDQDKNLYVQMTDGTWQDGKAPPPGSRKVGTTSSASAARVKYTFSDSDGNLYSQMTDGTWLEGKAAPPGAKRVGTEGKPPTPELSEHDYLQKNYPDEDLKVVKTPSGATVYERANGTQFQTKKGTSGRWGEIPINAAAHPVRLIQGTDGLKYRVAADGNPIDPIPDGVALGDKPKWTKVEGQGAYLSTLGPDGKLKSVLMIPEGVKMDQKDREEYADAVLAVSDAKEKKEAAELVASQDPKADKTLFGSSRAAKAKAELDAAQKRVQDIYVRYPQLEGTAIKAANQVHGTAPAATPSATPAPSTPAPAADTFPNEAAARAAGHKTGDIVMVVNPKTGRPARARLD